MYRMPASLARCTQGHPGAGIVLDRVELLGELPVFSQGRFGTKG